MINQGFKKVGVFCVKYSQMQSEESTVRAHTKNKTGKGKWMSVLSTNPKFRIQRYNDRRMPSMSQVWYNVWSN